MKTKVIINPFSAKTQLMKSWFLAVSLTALISLSATAQTPVNSAYAITSEDKGGSRYTEVKLVDLDNGEVISSIFGNSKGAYDVFDANTFKKITLVKQTDSTTDNNRPFSGFSAACAYDKKLNRLYYAPIFINQLRYIDLNTSVPAVYIFENEPFSKAGDMDVEKNHITRMVIASDGNGYALNNDGSHLIRFTTAKTPVVTDLGELSDAADNGELSIKDANTSWGGDMIADASGNIYIITSHNHVFKVDVQTKTASYIAEIKNLPPGFTTNGAVVDAEGNVMLSSANSFAGYFKADPYTWKASPVASSDHVYNTSDLANDNLLFKTKLTVAPVAPASEKISVYPNPVRTNSFNVSFANRELGRYNVQLIDIAGRMVSERAVSVQHSGQVSEVKLDPSLSRGMYMVKVLNNEHKEVFLRKIIVE